MALRREGSPRSPLSIVRDETRWFCMQTAVRATVSLRQPAHVIKFPDDDDDDGGRRERGREGGSLRQAERKASIRAK